MLDLLMRDVWATAITESKFDFQHTLFLVHSN